MNQAIQIMDITTLKAVLTDLKDDIIPSRFEKAQQPDPNTIQLGFRTLKDFIWIEVSWRADAPRIVKINSPQKKGGESTLSKQLQSSLSTLTLVKIEQEGFERVVKLLFAKRPGSLIEKQAIIELMGHHSNFLLLGSNKKVITIGKQVRDFHSRLRPISTGDFYSPPPPLKGEEPTLQESFKDWKKKLSLIPISLKKALQTTYQGISPAVSLQLANENYEIAIKLLNQPIQELKGEDWEMLYQRWKSWLETIDKQSYGLSFEGPSIYRVWGHTQEPSKEGGISYLLGIYYNEKLIEKEIKIIQVKLENCLRKAKESEYISLTKQIKLLNEVSDYKSMQAMAIEIFSKESPNKDEILKAQLLFKKAKKKKRSSSALMERIDHHKKKISSLEESEALVNCLLSTEIETKEEKLKRVIEIKQEIDEYHFPSKTKHQRANSQTKGKIPTQITELISPSGLTIQIGRNHKQNELISLRNARNGDLWFHSQECPGSHIILKSSAGLTESEDIQLAADLAAFFSKARGNKIVPIIMASTQKLRRIPGSLPGTVSHKGGKVLWGDVSRAMKHIQQQ